MLKSALVMPRNSLNLKQLSKNKKNNLNLKPDPLVGAVAFFPLNFQVLEGGQEEEEGLQIKQIVH